MDYKRAPQKGFGFIYILSNPSMLGIYKIGLTKNNVGKRIGQLSNTTGIPTTFKVEKLYEVEIKYLRAVEKAIHKDLKKKGLHQGKEFFKTTLDDCIKYTETIIQQFIDRYPTVRRTSAGNIKEKYDRTVHGRAHDNSVQNPVNNHHSSNNFRRSSSNQRDIFREKTDKAVHGRSFTANTEKRPPIIEKTDRAIHKRTDTNFSSTTEERSHSSKTIDPSETTKMHPSQTQKNIREKSDRAIHRRAGGDIILTEQNLKIKNHFTKKKYYRIDTGIVNKETGTFISFSSLSRDMFPTPGYSGYGEFIRDSDIEKPIVRGDSLLLSCPFCAAQCEALVNSRGRVRCVGCINN